MLRSFAASFARHQSRGPRGSQSQRISPEPEPRSSGFPALQGVGPRASESCRMPPGADSDFVKGAAWHGFRGRWSQRAVLAVNCSLSVHSSPLRPSGGNGRGMLLTSLLAGTPRYIGCPRCPVLCFSAGLDASRAADSARLPHFRNKNHPKELM